MTNTFTRIESLVLWAGILVILSLFGLAVSPAIGSLKYGAGNDALMRRDRPAMILPCEKHDKTKIWYLVPKPVKPNPQKMTGLEGLV